MTDSTPQADRDAVSTPLPHKAVIVGLQPGQPAHVLEEAVKYARLLAAPLVVVHVDVTRFVVSEDPDGYVHSAPIDLNLDMGVAEFEQVQQEASDYLADKGLEWAARQLVGDPALAIKRLAEKLDAPLIVVGTRKRGLGESIREFFTGSVAARLAHRQHRSVLVVPQGELTADEHKDPWSD